MSETPTDPSAETPIDRVLARINTKRYSKGYLAHCPAHRDTEESLAIWEDGEDEHVGIKCYAGCTRKAVVEAMGLTEQDLYRQKRKHLVRATEPGIMLLDLAKAKRIHPTFLVNLDLLDMTYKGRDAVRIPYWLPDGFAYSRYRIRTSLVAKEGSIWSKGDASIIPYGLQKLSEGRVAGYLILVEGESDCWTLWSHGYPALGIPGAALSTCLKLEYFEGIPRLYVMQEPDKAGTALPGSVRAHLQKLGFTGSIYALNLDKATDAKDPNALHLREGSDDRFKTAFQLALDQAQDLALVPTSSSGKGSGSDTTGAGSSDGLTSLPEILINNVQLRDIVNASIEAILLREKDHPTLFMQASRLVRIGRDEKHRPVIVQMGVSEVKEVLTHAANFYRLKKAAGEDGEYAQIAVSPPKEIAEQILARQAQEPYLPFPALEGIVETPVLRPNGSILDQPGYDKKTRLYYAQTEEMKACTVPQNPTRLEQEAALSLIWQAFGEFAYAGEADRANALALLLTPIVRPAIKEHVPMALVDAPKRGTGKGLLCNGIALTVIGSPAPILTVSTDPDEMKKMITSILIEGATIIVIDNITGVLQSHHLDAALTTNIWSDRILGVSKNARVPQRATWMATGNNIHLGGDLPSRTYRIRLDAHISRPEKRRDFTIPDLSTWITEHRAELVSALLTLACAWYVAGCPLDESLPAMRTFTGWVKIVGGILKHAGVSGFLANLDALIEQADEDSVQWESFLSTWLDHFGDAWVSTAAVSKALLNAEVAEGSTLFAGGCDENDKNSLFSALPEWLQVALKEKPNSFKVRLGKALERRVDACFGQENLRLEKMRDQHSKKVLWRVLRGVAGGVYPLREEKNLDFHSSEEETPKNAYGNGGKEPPQPPAKRQENLEQNAGNGSTGGSVISCEMETPPKTGQKPQNGHQPPANENGHTTSTPPDEEREVFTL